MMKTKVTLSNASVTLIGTIRNIFFISEVFFNDCMNWQFDISLIVTYIPTILMNLINQLTNYITGDTKYDLVYTINITCMMVLASVYLSVSASLPSTSDIKPVEVWLLFNLSYPFLVILVNVLMQVTLSVLWILIHLIKSGDFEEIW